MASVYTKEEAHEFLDSHPGWLILSTVGKDGYPHSVPLGYVRMGDEIFVGGRAGSQRVKNVERDSRVSALLEAGRTMQDIKGLLIKGDADVITKPEEVLPLMRETAKSRGTPEDKLPTEARPGVAYIRVRPRRFMSWDYARQGRG